MKTKLFLFASLVCTLGMQAQIVDIPDTNLKTFLLSSSPSNTIAKNLNGNYFAIDSNNDGNIQQSEADQVGSLEIINLDINATGNNPIQNYQGVLSFTHIKNIKIDYWNVPTHPFTINNLPTLENLEVSFNNSDPGNASITHCSNLKNLSIKGIYLQNFTNNPALKNLNIGFTSTTYQNVLSTIEGLSQLETLTLQGYFFTSGTTSGTLNLSHHQSLTQVTINSLGLSSLDVSHSNLLNSVNINMGDTFPGSSPKYFGTLNISACPLITNLNINENSNITGLIAESSPNLQSIECYSKYLGTLNINSSPVLHSVKLAGNEVLLMNNTPALKDIKITKYSGTSFDATNAINLENLELGYFAYTTAPINLYGNLQNLTINNNLKLKKLIIDNHTLTQFAINGLPQLESLFISAGYFNVNNSPIPDFNTEFLQSVNIQNCPALANASFNGQEGLKSIVIKNCPVLQDLNHSSSTNNFTNVPIWALNSLEVEDCASLHSVNVSYNTLNHLKIKNCQNLESIDVRRNELTAYEFINTNKLKNLKLTGNKFTHLDISTIPSVVSLDGAFNSLQTITGTSSNLKNLGLFSNHLTTLNIQNFPNLDSLIIGRNRMVDVDFSGHAKIRMIYEHDPDYAYSNLNLPYANTPNYTKTFNVNNCINLQLVAFSSSTLEKIYAKNGANESLSLPYNASNLQYICCDASQIQNVQDELDMGGITGCTVNSDCPIDNLVLATSTAQEKFSVKISPNPTKGNLSISSDQKISSIEIYDRLGKLIQKQSGINAETAQLSIQHIPSGVYIVKVITDKETLIKKIIKN
ncbi:T9SS type A sorting domain-containing protein [Chryseobacterium tructae]|uniref:T9SS type A sorting domain-containing protein n=1 Tax=Chryseobacterium tructae TaxID=1037380 RepID=A0ABV7XRM9_9FLAO|nr:T9SS type A sorting domain-containing protein [Chryseobacterium tructae]MDN3695026.1 T9SS type A sorting domain-containing protein [Chryseobacterium tructae]